MTTATSENDFLPEWTLGDRLAKARSVAGLTQAEMAEKLDVSHSTVAKWEIDKGQPRDFLVRIHQWAEITGVSVWWLLGAETAGRSPVRLFDLSAVENDKEPYQFSIMDYLAVPADLRSASGQ